MPFKDASNRFFAAEAAFLPFFSVHPLIIAFISAATRAILKTYPK
jgi:hypothetical protein